MGEQASPQQRISSRALVIVTVVLAVALLVTVVVALVVWHTPALQPVDLLVVRKA